MKLNRKWMLVVALVLSVAMATSGTMAYLTSEDADVNVMTLGNVKIEQHEYERATNADGSYKTATIDNRPSYVLTDFTPGKPLLPTTEVDAKGEPYNFGAGDYDTTTVRMSQVNSYGGMDVFVSKNAQDKIVTVKNTGKTDAYIRTIVAFEVGSTDGSLLRFSKHFTWDDNDVGIVKINDNNYMVYEFTYNGYQDSTIKRHLNGILPAGDTSYPNLSQVYLKAIATNEDMEAIDGNNNGTLDIMVLSQAVQAAGFANAKTALNTAFGETTATNVQKWLGNASENEPPVVHVTTAKEMADAVKAAGEPGAGSSVVTLTSDLDLTNENWSPIEVHGYQGAGVITINGNGKTIKGLTAPLFKGGFAGESGIVIKNLTIDNSNIVSTNDQGSGAFIECADSMETITLFNCHLTNSTLRGAGRTGGLVGWTSGYSNQNDGPVKTYVTIENCSVVNCEITAPESVGGLYGHAGASDWTYSTVKDCTVKGNKLVSTNSSDWRVGVVVGTANVGELTIENVTASNNTLKQANATTAPSNNLYGRIALGTTGKLVIDGVEIKQN